MEMRIQEFLPKGLGNPYYEVFAEFQIPIPVRLEFNIFYKARIFFKWKNLKVLRLLFSISTVIVDKLTLVQNMSRL